MYIIKFNTTKEEVFKGNFPLDYLQSLWDKGVKFIILSTYSNTIKVPKESKYDTNGENTVDFDEYIL